MGTVSNVFRGVREDPVVKSLMGTRELGPSLSLSAYLLRLIIFVGL